MAFNPLHPRFIQSSVPRSMANASNGAPNPTIDEASSIQIVKESIRLVTGDSIIKASLKGPEAIRLLTKVEENEDGHDLFLRFSNTLVGALMSCFPGASSSQFDAVSLWGEFHKTRLSEKLHAAWRELTPSTSLEQGTMAIAFQLLVTFCMKIIIKKKLDQQSPVRVREVHVCEVQELSLREKNVIRYPPKPDSSHCATVGSYYK